MAMPFALSSAHRQSINNRLLAWVDLGLQDVVPSCRGFVVAGLGHRAVHDETVPGLPAVGWHWAHNQA